MCIPELILLPPSPKLHSHSHAAPRPFSAESMRDQPLLSSPPFIIQVSPKIPQHRSRPQRRRSSSRSTCEELEWREGFRAERHAYSKKALINLERSSKANIKPAGSSTSKEGCTESRKGKDGPPAPVPAPASPSRPNESASEPPKAPTKPSIQPTSPTSINQLKPAVPSYTATPSRVNPSQHPTQPDPYIYEHRRLYHSRPRYHSPSSESTSSRSIRALRKRLSVIWAHVSGLEKWAQREEAREQERERTRVVIGRRGSRGSREVDHGRRRSKGRRTADVLGPDDEWARSKWNMERGL